MNKKIILIITLVFVALGIFVLSSFIKIPYTISSRGMVYPVGEWTLGKTVDGNLINVLKDNRTNSISHYNVTEFLRGDASEFVLNKAVFFKTTINKGDTVGYISSNEELLKLLELEGQLAAEKSSYIVNSTGQKPEDIQYQKDRLDLASQEYDNQKKIFGRIEKLFNDSLISKNEFDIALNELKIKEHNYRIAFSYLSLVKTGAKNEQLDLNKSLIQSLEFQIAQVEKRISKNNILSPFTGSIVRQKSSNVDANGNLIDVENIIKVVDTSSLLVVLPVEFYEIENLKIGGQVNFSFNAQKKTVQGKIIDIDNTVQILKRREVIFITVELKENTEQMMLNMIVEAEIDCGIISFKEYMRRLFNSITEN